MEIQNIYIFYGCVSLLPLFFLYLLYRNLAWRWRWKQWFDGYYAKRGQVARRNDVERLITELSSSDRGLNISALQRIMQSEAKSVDLLLAALDMPYYQSRNGKYVYTEGEETSIFVKSVNKTHPFLVNALTSIGHHSPEELKAALQSPNLNVRITVMSALEQLNDISVADSLLPFLDSDNLDEKAFAIRALGGMRATNTFEMILSALNHMDVYVRATAIVALGNIGDERALPFLEEISRFDKTIIDGTDQILGQLAEMAV